MLLKTFDSISEQWIILTRECIRRGHVVLDEDVRLRELLGVPFRITNPSDSDAAIREYGDPKMVRAMIANFIESEPQFGYAFAYGERIWAGTPSNYARVRELLRRKPESKSATISLVLSDVGSDGHVPCVTTIDFKIRDDRLDLFYFARSQDLFKKAYADNIALHMVQQRLANDLRVVTGSIAGFIASAHVYEEDLARALSLEPFRDLDFGVKESTREDQEHS